MSVWKEHRHSIIVNKSNEKAKKQLWDCLSIFVLVYVALINSRSKTYSLILKRAKNRLWELVATEVINKYYQNTTVDLLGDIFSCWLNTWSVVYEISVGFGLFMGFFEEFSRDN